MILDIFVDFACLLVFHSNSFSLSLSNLPPPNIYGTYAAAYFGPLVWILDPMLYKSQKLYKTFIVLYGFQGAQGLKSRQVA